MKTLAVIFLLVSATSCAHKVKLLDASAISMTHASVEPGQNLVEIGEVESEFCPDTFKDKGSIGLIDEAVKSAQKKSGADFIKNVTIWYKIELMSACIQVEGTGAKVATKK